MAVVTIIRDRARDLLIQGQNVGLPVLRENSDGYSRLGIVRRWLPASKTWFVALSAGIELLLGRGRCMTRSLSGNSRQRCWR